MRYNCVNIRQRIYLITAGRSGTIENNTTNIIGGHESIIRIKVGSGGISRFLPLFQEGVMLETDIEISVREFFYHTLKIDDDYAENRISTIFLNNKTVDDLDNSIIFDGSVLALSAAMPGLVGATLRRGGYYARMRSSISHEADSRPVQRHRGRIRLKLFNMILDELGPSLLCSGISARAGSLKGILAHLTRDGLIEDIRLPEHEDELRLIIIPSSDV